MDQLAALLRLTIPYLIVFLYSKEASQTMLPPVKIIDVNEKHTIKTIANAPSRIYFSGLWWKITNAPNTPRSPGKNYWSAANVWVDAKGLHLKLSKDLKTGKWYCAQIASEKTFGDGTYQFFIKGRVDKLDPNVVFGLFNYSGVDFHDEMDIEFTKWGKDTTSNLHYTVWPAEGKKSAEWTIAKRISLNSSSSTHRFKRTSTSVNFESLSGFQHSNSNKLLSATCTEQIISKKAMPILINLWLYQNKPPTDQKEVELIIKEFKFIPL